MVHITCEILLADIIPYFPLYSPRVARTSTVLEWVFQRDSRTVDIHYFGGDPRSIVRGKRKTEKRPSKGYAETSRLRFDLPNVCNAA